MLARRPLACMFLLAIVLGNHALARTWPPTPEARNALQEFRDRLEKQAAEEFNLPFPARFSITHMYEIRQAWEIKIDAVLADHLDELGIEPRDDRTLQFAAWAATVNERLVGLTKRAIEEAGIDPLYTPEVDHELRIWGLVRAPASPPPPRREPIAGIPPFPNEDESRFWSERYAAVTFLGQRCTSVYDGKERLDHGPPPEGLARFSTRIELDAPEFPFRSSITGRLTVTNTGECRLPIGYHDLRLAAIVITPEGKQAEFSAVIGLGHPPVPEWWNRPLLPGESYSEPFVIATDPAQGSLAYRLPRGEHAVSAEFRLSPLSDLPNRLEPAPFRVTGDPDAYYGPRARRAQSAGDRLLIFREDRWIEAINPSSGERVGILRTVGYPESLGGDTSIAFSGDATLMALGSRREDPVSIHSLGGEPPVSIPMNGDRRPIHENGQSIAMGFGPDGRSAYFESDRGMIAFDTQTGEEVWRSPLHLYGPRLSPDGRFIVTAFDPQGRRADGVQEAWHARGPFDNRGVPGHTIFTFLSTDPGATPVVRRVRDRGDEPYVTLGLHGLYAVHALHGGVTYVPYDDAMVRILGTGSVTVDSESTDGSLVILRSPGGPTHDRFDRVPTGPSTLEIWDVAEGRLLYSISDGRAISARFVSSPPVLVILEYHSINGAFWMREHAELRDARTGDLIRQIDITPREPFPDVADPWGEPEEPDEDG